MTTLEVSNVGRYGYMGGRGGVSASSQSGLVEKWKAGTAAGADGIEEEDGCRHSHGRSGSTGANSATPRTTTKKNFLLKILGIDRFTQGKAAEGLAKSGSVTNPFDLGLWNNCRDFWTRGRELGVEYTRLYEVPEGGFGRARRERKRREKEEGASAGAGGERASRPRKGGYERLRMEDERVALDEV